MQFSNASHQTSQFDFITLLTLPAKKKKKKTATRQYNKPTWR